MVGYCLVNVRILISLCIISSNRFTDLFIKIYSMSHTHYDEALKKSVDAVFD
jgi:hypothetical protein